VGQRNSHKKEREGASAAARESGYQSRFWELCSLSLRRPLLFVAAVAIRDAQPFHNPAESYQYYSLPYCSPKVGDGKSGSSTAALSSNDNLGEVLAGDRRKPALYDLRFGVDIQWTALCQFTLSQDDIKQFMSAIKQHYMFEMFVDELPVKGFVGDVHKETLTSQDGHTHTAQHIYLFTHLDFSISYNGNNIIAVNLTTDPQQQVELEYDKNVSHTPQLLLQHALSSVLLTLPIKTIHA
jgi:hypothetical protein